MKKGSRQSRKIDDQRNAKIDYDRREAAHYIREKSGDIFPPNEAVDTLKSLRQSNKPYNEDVVVDAYKRAKVAERKRDSDDSAARRAVGSKRVDDAQKSMEDGLKIAKARKHPKFFEPKPFGMSAKDYKLPKLAKPVEMKRIIANIKSPIVSPDEQLNAGFSKGRKSQRGSLGKSPSKPKKAKKK